MDGEKKGASGLPRRTLVRISCRADIPQRNLEKAAARKPLFCVSRHTRNLRSQYAIRARNTNGLFWIIEVRCGEKPGWCGKVRRGAARGTPPPSHSLSVSQGTVALQHNGTVSRSHRALQRDGTRAVAPSHNRSFSPDLLFLTPRLHHRPHLPLHRLVSPSRCSASSASRPSPYISSVLLSLVSSLHAGRWTSLLSFRPGVSVRCLPHVSCASSLLMSPLCVQRLGDITGRATCFGCECSASLVSCSPWCVWCDGFSGCHIHG